MSIWWNTYLEKTHLRPCAISNGMQELMISMWQWSLGWRKFTNNVKNEGQTFAFCGLEAYHQNRIFDKQHYGFHMKISLPSKSFLDKAMNKHLWPQDINHAKIIPMHVKTHWQLLFCIAWISSQILKPFHWMPFIHIVSRIKIANCIQIGINMPGWALTHAICQFMPRLCNWSQIHRLGLYCHNSILSLMMPLPKGHFESLWQ